MAIGMWVGYWVGVGSTGPKLTVMAVPWPRGLGEGGGEDCPYPLCCVVL